MSSLPAHLLVFCKQPRINQGKQRIAATLGAQSAFNIASGLLQCALQDAQEWPGSVTLSPSTAEDHAWASSLLENVSVIPQPEGNLGQRIMIVDAELRAQGHRKIVIIGTDAPILNARYYEAALHALDNYDVVFSAASDGGVTLMAANQPWPDIEHLPWSTEQLNDALLAACQEQGLSVGYITPSYDIDHEEDLEKLLVDLEHDERSSRQALCKVIVKELKKEQMYA